MKPALEVPPEAGPADGDGIAIRAISGARLRHEAGGWAFAERERARIDAYWQELVARNPKLWNGDILMGFDPAITDGRLTARLRSSDYASYVAWRDWGFADAAAWNCFGTPVIMSGDEALLYGVMAGYTLNAGLAYPPSGTLEGSDIGPGGLVDLAGSMTREVREETGLDLGKGRAGEIFAVFEARRLSIAQVYRFDQPAAALIERIEAFIAAEDEPELAGVVAVKGPRDLERPMPPYARALARHVLGL